MKKIHERMRTATHTHRIPFGSDEKRPMKQVTPAAQQNQHQLQQKNVMTKKNSNKKN